MECARRTAVKMAGAAVAATALGMPALAGAAEAGWDKEVDLLVVGSGTAAVAAMTAAVEGAGSVLVIEKSAVWGGTSATSGGGVAVPANHYAAEAGIEDGVELAEAYYVAASQGRVDREVLASFLDKGDKYLRWTEEKLGWSWTISTMYQDYYEPVEGYVPVGRGSLFALLPTEGEPAAANGMTLWAAIRDAVESHGGEVLLETVARELVADETGAVVGVVAEGPQGTLRIGARAVVLGTGGFDYNDAMRAKHLPIPLVTTNAAPGNTGDGHRMGQMVGADLAYMDKFWGVGGLLTSGEDPADLIAENRIACDPAGADWSMYRCRPGAVVVNRHGRRFGDECAAYSPWAEGYLAYDNARMEFSNLRSFILCDADCWERYGFPGHAAGEELDPDGIWRCADTLEELAEMLGIDPEGLADEIAAFNEHAEAGEDPKFLRGTKQFAKNTCGVYAGDRPDLANPVIAPLAKAPFYGTFYVPGTCGTCGGLVINGDARVMRADGTPIEGLYAAGNCSSGVSGGRYMHGGLTLGSGSVMAWAAARHALGLA